MAHVYLVAQEVAEARLRCRLAVTRRQAAFPGKLSLMAINEWWTTDPEQRFWMEITDRDDLGADLFAPMADGSGRPYWGYELITYVQPGDIVLHWHKTLADEPGIVGWSQATGAYEDTDISWQAHGTVGRASGSLKPRPAWRMPLLNYTPLANPVLISEVRSLDAELRKVQSDLEAEYPAEPSTSRSDSATNGSIEPNRRTS